MSANKVFLIKVVKIISRNEYLLLSEVGGGAMPPPGSLPLTLLIFSYIAHIYPLLLISSLYCQQLPYIVYLPYIAPISPILPTSPLYCSHLPHITHTTPHISPILSHLPYIANIYPSYIAHISLHIYLNC